MSLFCVEDPISPAYPGFGTRPWSNSKYHHECLFWTPLEGLTHSSRQHQGGSDPVMRSPIDPMKACQSERIRYCFFSDLCERFALYHSGYLLSILIAVRAPLTLFCQQKSSKWCKTCHLDEFWGLSHQPVCPNIVRCLSVHITQFFKNIRAFLLHRQPSYIQLPSYQRWSNSSMIPSRGKQSGSASRNSSSQPQTSHKKCLAFNS